MAAQTSIIPPTPSEEDYAATGERAPIPDMDDPIALFGDWLTAARESEHNDANAMSVATVDPAGMPDVRTVLLKDFGPDGFTFYTNLESAKAAQIAATGKAAILFHWKSMERQVRIRGPVSRTSDEAADAYFASRARISQIGAWASAQSHELVEREALKARVALFTDLFEEDDAIARPPYWGGYVLAPETIEFWQGQAYRLHDRLKYAFSGENAGWTRTRLNP
ncbi:MAG: pyridoxamine 5'-phosphate oxidase [Alphaproteobacteria bacterium]|jgi:pyridoxamine 5'-phosphate oxidase|nr:pyridoxamine 5'-phosphate oxidase [Alphaproteobacteria bacterium]